MAERQLWLLRHGATEWALNGRHTGTTDLPLLPQGEQEAEALAPILSSRSFAAVFTSPLQRARRTCELAGLGQNAEIVEDLKEWNYGDYEGITTKEIRQTVPDWTIWTHGCPGGEDGQAVQSRCQLVIERALAAPGPGDVALFAHGHILRALSGTWIGLGAAGGKMLILGTASISILGFERESRAISRWNAPTGGKF